MEISYALEDINPDIFDLVDGEFSSIPIDSGLGSCACCSSSTAHSLHNDAAPIWSSVPCSQPNSCPFEASNLFQMLSDVDHQPSTDKTGVKKKTTKTPAEKSEATASGKKQMSTDKPPEPYADIIAKAILSNGFNLMQLKEIYAYMSEKW